MCVHAGDMPNTRKRRPPQSMLAIRQVSPGEDRDQFMAARPNRDTIVADSGTFLFREAQKPLEPPWFEILKTGQG